MQVAIVVEMQVAIGLEILSCAIFARPTVA
jgi:hypothetical protein